jgi:hypothetical protein
MYALIHCVGHVTEVLAVSEDKSKLSQRMKEEVLTVIEEIYGNDPDALDWLMPISDDMTYWSDEDEEYPIIYHIEETEVI